MSLQHLEERTVLNRLKQQERGSRQPHGLSAHAPVDGYPTRYKALNLAQNLRQEAQKIAGTQPESGVIAQRAGVSYFRLKWRRLPQTPFFHLKKS